LPEGLTTFEEALAAAEAEIGLAEPVEPQADLPSDQEDAEPTPEQAPEKTEEHPEGNEVEGLLDILAEEAAQAPTVKTDDPDFWNTEVEIELDGESKRITLDELRKGSMMRADYTRKTQEVARERALLSEAADFHKAFREDPDGFARYLAQKAGLLEEEAGNAPEGVRLFTEDEIEAKVAERLEQAIAEHPDIKAAQQEQALVAVDHAFGRLEDRLGSKLNNQHRIAILQEAKRRGVSDIELVFDSLLLRAQQSASQRGQAKQSASTRPGATPPTEVEAPPKKVASIEEAWALAVEELAESVV
jgi:hypothetical protein